MTTDLTPEVENRIAELRDGIEWCHEEQRQGVSQGRAQETMTLFQHWSACAGWLASRVRSYERGDNPGWPDAVRHAPPTRADIREALEVCSLGHGHEGNVATVYGHHGSLRNCIRTWEGLWVYDPRWESTTVAERDAALEAPDWTDPS